MILDCEDGQENIGSCIHFWVQSYFNLFYFSTLCSPPPALPTLCTRLCLRLGDAIFITMSVHLNHISHFSTLALVARYARLGQVARGARSPPQLCPWQGQYVRMMCAKGIGKEGKVKKKGVSFSRPRTCCLSKLNILFLPVWLSACMCVCVSVCTYFSLCAFFSFFFYSSADVVFDHDNIKY